jgi:hypothetical protein
MTERTLESMLGAIRNACEVISARSYNGDVKGARLLQDALIADLKGQWGIDLAHAILNHGWRKETPPRSKYISG